MAKAHWMNEIQFEKRWWADVYTGTREALIAAGHAKPDQFPGEPGCGKTSTSFLATPELRKMRVSRRSADMFQVAVHCTREERQARVAAATAKVEAKATAYRAEIADQLRARRREDLRQHLAEPGGVRRLADVALEAGIIGIIRAFNLCGLPDVPYGFDEATTAEAKGLARQLMALHARARFTVRAGAVAQRDPEFQRFIQRAAGAYGKAA